MDEVELIHNKQKNKTETTKEYEGNCQSVKRI